MRVCGHMWPPFKSFELPRCESLRRRRGASSQIAMSRDAVLARFEPGGGEQGRNESLGHIKSIPSVLEGRTMTHQQEVKWPKRV